MAQPKEEFPLFIQTKTGQSWPNKTEQDKVIPATEDGRPRSTNVKPSEGPELLFNPMTGQRMTERFTAGQFRAREGDFAAWLFNPWTGVARNSLDVGSDMFGYLIAQPPKPVADAVRMHEMYNTLSQAIDDGCTVKLVRDEDSSLMMFLVTSSAGVSAMLPFDVMGVVRHASFSERINQIAALGGNKNTLRSMVEGLSPSDREALKRLVFHTSRE